MKIIRPVQIGEGNLVQSSLVENDFPAWSATKVYAKGDKVLDVVKHKIYESVVGIRGEVTITIASPAMATMKVGGEIYTPAVNSPFKFATSGTLPASMLATTTYYVRTITDGSFTFSTTPSGTPINTSSFTQTGVHTATTLENSNKALTDKSFWIDAGASNKWKPFDTFIQSQATAVGSMSFSVKSPTYIDTVALLNVSASKAIITVSHPTDGVVFSKEVALVREGGVVANWYDYFFASFKTKRDLIVEDIPLYTGVTIKVELISLSGGTVALGAAIYGLAENIAINRNGAEHGAKIGIQSFDTKKRDDFGNYTIVPRAFAKRADFTIYIDNDELDNIQELLTDIRSVPTLFLGSSKYASTMIYGYYKSFDIDISYPTFSVCSIQLEGLT